MDSVIHAADDKHAIRDRVFALLTHHNLRVDTTILEKAKAAPSTRTSDVDFYQLAWYLHMRHVAPKIAEATDALLVVCASPGAKKERARFRWAVQDVIQQVSPTLTFHVASWEARSDPCLQITDYCAWAIQRKWEKSDDRSYQLIADKIASEFAPF